MLVLFVGMFLVVQSVYEDRVTQLEGQLAAAIMQPMPLGREGGPADVEAYSKDPSGVSWIVGK